MAGIFDQILDRTGYIGAKVRGYELRAQRDAALMNKPPKPTRSAIIDSQGKIVYFEVAKDINHDYPSKVTSFPVDNRSTISDHVVNENATFSLTGVFSDASSESVKALNNMTQQEVLEYLKKLRAERKTISLITPLDKTQAITDLVIKNLSFPRSSDTGRSLVVNIEFEQIRLVSAGTTTIPVREADTKTKTTEQVKAGDKPAQTSSEAVEDKKPQGIVYTVLGDTVGVRE